MHLDLNNILTFALDNKTKILKKKNIITFHHTVESGIYKLRSVANNPLYFSLNIDI